LRFVWPEGIAATDVALSRYDPDLDDNGTVVREEVSPTR